MTNESGEDLEVFQVLVNQEGQYSLWPDKKSLPNGWRSVDKKGTKANCLEYIDSVWTDMRPKTSKQR